MKYVTRTIVGTRVSTLNLNTETCEPHNESYLLPVKFDSAITNDKWLNKVKKIGDTDTDKVVSVVDVQPENKLLGMPETDFIANAVELDPETRKEYEEVEG